MDDTLILASASPRRRELLDQIGIRHRVVPADIDESCRPGEPVRRYVERIAMAKARAVMSREGSAPAVLAADTTVVLDGEIVGKPGCVTEAATMLRRLSGRTHVVMSAVALLVPGREPGTALNVSRVTFGVLDDDWIEAYCASGEPLDKAGAYGVQGYAAERIRWLEGSFSGVMGLPLYETGTLLRNAGWKPAPHR